MISEEEFRDMQEEMDEMREALDRLAAMNEALQEALFAALQSTPVQQELFANLIDHTLDHWLLKRRDLGSPSARLLQRVRDDVLAKPQEESLDFQPAKPRPALRAVPVLRPSEGAPIPEQSPDSVEHGPWPAAEPAVESQQAPRAPGVESPPGKDE